MTNQELWQAVLAQIQLKISPANFATWFKKTGILSRNEGTVYISVPNSFAKEWLEQKYNKIIFKTLRDLDRGIRSIEYKIGKKGLKVLQKIPPSTPSVTEEQLEFKKFTVEKDTNLNHRYTFENFVVGSFNELAHAAAWAVSESPGQVYNPLFLYGGVGLGKTHLLQAIGNRVVQKCEEKKVIYIPAEKFVSRVISAIKNHQIEQLKATYQTLDILIIDDIQFLSGKEKTQEEFFYTFNSLYEKNKQIILSSDRPPKAIPSLTERLRSRFEGGMIADISLPEFETRMAILKTKCQERGTDIPLEVLEYIASNIKKNIRELEGALNILTAHNKLHEDLLDLESAKSLLKNLTTSKNKIINAKKIIESVAEFYDLGLKEICSDSRKREIVRPRQIAMYLLREELDASYPFIGRKLGGKDHTTAIHAYEKISKLLKGNNGLGEEIELIKQKVLCI
ncbi:MAG: chromosomal replication initiator protein DnaA [Candidatus Nealsonbacteria bacterium]|nr:chromosomal replication initiator protein DnaA [Candidatus Nealsonbacteria bacterium]